MEKFYNAGGAVLVSREVLCGTFARMIVVGALRSADSWKVAA